MDSIKEIRRAIDRDRKAAQETRLVFGRLADKTVTLWISWVDFGKDKLELKDPVEVPLSILGQ